MANRKLTETVVARKGRKRGDQSAAGRAAASSARLTCDWQQTRPGRRTGRFAV